MLLKIRQTGDPVLRARARDLSLEEVRSAEIQQLIELMRETMRDAPGVGLAAPQIGAGLRLAVIEDRSEYLIDVSEEDLAARERRPVPFHVIINPVLEPGSETVEFFEGCLSLTGFTALTPRAQNVKVTCLNEEGEPREIHASGWYARILQHEIDHLNGTLYIDRMHPRSFMTIESYKRHWKNHSVAHLKEALALAD